MTTMLALLQAASTAMTIAPPVPVTRDMIRAAPSTAARAITVSGDRGAAKASATIVLQCLVDPAGRLGGCATADDGGTSDAAVFGQRRAAAQQRANGDPVLAAALERALFYRIRPPARSGGALPTILLRETISPADRIATSPARGMIERGGLAMTPLPGVEVNHFYPVRALRDEAEARVTVTCRVLPDRSLLCRDAQIDSAGENPDRRVPALDGNFGQATTRVLAAMRADPRTKTGEESVGRDVPVSLRWSMPF